MDDLAAERPGQSKLGDEPAVLLTRQELTVLTMLADGLRRSEIAWALELSVRSLHDLRRRVYAKLGARSDEHAVAIAFRRGLLTVDRRGTA